MLIRRSLLEAIRRGSVSLAFRKWVRPSVVAGGRLRTSVGVLGIDAVDAVSRADISARDAASAGFESREALLAELDRRPDGRLYRIALHYLGPDDRKERARQTKVTDDLRRRLSRLSWAPAFLSLIEKSPGVRAADLAARVGLAKVKFKRDVRRLKELGLTESLKMGYRLSPLGVATLRVLEAQGRPPGRGKAK